MMIVSFEMAIKDLGLQVENAWKNLRPMTKEMLEEVMKPESKTSRTGQNFSYDAHADWEISRLLDALEEQAVTSKDNRKTETNLSEMNHLAEVCANVLEEQTKSAEIFIKLAKRALGKTDFRKIDRLADILLERFSTPEIAEIIRQTDVAQIRAIAYETLAVTPVASLSPLLRDPLYFEIVCNVLEQQAIEFENNEARMLLEKMDASNYFA